MVNHLGDPKAAARHGGSLKGILGGFPFQGPVSSPLVSVRLSTGACARHSCWVARLAPASPPRIPVALRPCHRPRPRTDGRRRRGANRGFAVWILALSLHRCVFYWGPHPKKERRKKKKKRKRTRRSGFPFGFSLRSQTQEYPQKGTHMMASTRGNQD